MAEKKRSAEEIKMRSESTIVNKVDPMPKGAKGGAGKSAKKSGK